ncbi:hypothetical protein [Streptomyces canus]|uniref:hypothetical protein n=1 Tax=Streptomyces canus TaxID=58343 RepID=UPI0022585952|nr:hypothetical protein [Streptomyces canus]MCX4856650.1 hypothetical protein [Streptomyces canus]
MADEQEVRARDLARELQQLIGKRGTYLEAKFIQSLPALRGLSQLQARVNEQSSPEAVIRSTEEVIRAGTRHLLNRYTLNLSNDRTKRIAPEQARKAIDDLLALSDRTLHLKPIIRRDNVRYDLGLDYISSDDFRRPNFQKGPELQLMLLLARALIAGSESWPLRVDKLHVIGCVSPLQRDAECTWNITVLRDGAHTVRLPCNWAETRQAANIALPGGEATPVGSMCNWIDHSRRDRGPPLTYQDFFLPQLQAGQQVELRAHIAQENETPWLETWIRLLAMEPRPLEVTVIIHFTNDHPTDVVWSFEGLVDDSEIEDSQFGAECKYQVTATRSVSHTFIRPTGRYGLGWDSEELYSALAIASTKKGWRFYLQP